MLHIDMTVAPFSPRPELEDWRRRVLQLRTEHRIRPTKPRTRKRSHVSLSLWRTTTASRSRLVRLMTAEGLWMDASK